MNGQDRVSPLTALVVGIFGLGAVGIAAGAGVLLYGMRIVDTKAAAVLGVAAHAVESLPDLVESLPPAVERFLSDRRAPEYAGHVDVQVRFVPHERSGGLQPVLKVTNTGDEVLSLLTVRVAALDENGAPVREWTEVVATPLAVSNAWRGLLFPGVSRHVLVSDGRPLSGRPAAHVTASVEISELRLWQSPPAPASAQKRDADRAPTG